MDAFYASVEQRDEPRLRGKPVVVGAPGVARRRRRRSYEARAFGVRSAMPMARALRLCPDLVVAAGLRALSARLGPGHGDPARVHAARRAARSTRLTSMSPRTPGASRSAWKSRRAEAPDRRCNRLTASAGVAPNKFLAKIARATASPTAQRPSRLSAWRAFCASCQVEALWGVGPYRQKASPGGNHAPAPTCAPWTCSVCAKWSAVLPTGCGNSARRRSATCGARARGEVPSSENTYAQDLVDLDKIREEVARMARENAAWLARRGLAARTVTLKVRYAGFVTVTRSHTLSRHTADAEVISSWAVELFAHRSGHATGAPPRRARAGFSRTVRELARRVQSAGGSFAAWFTARLDGRPARFSLTEQQTLIAGLPVVGAPRAREAACGHGPYRPLHPARW